MTDRTYFSNSDAIIVLHPLQCPYVSPLIRCIRQNDVTCNDTSCPKDATCCGYECDGMRCVGLNQMCPGISSLDGTGTCSSEDKTVNCAMSNGCGEQASCCENQCGGTQCLARKFHGVSDQSTVPNGFHDPFTANQLLCSRVSSK